MDGIRLDAHKKEKGLHQSRAGRVVTYTHALSILIGTV